MGSWDDYFKKVSGEHSFFVYSALLIFANFSGSILGYCYHLVVARCGGQIIYADFGVLLSILSLLSVVSMAVQFYVCHLVLQATLHNQEAKFAIGRCLKKVFLLTFLGAIILSLVSKQLSFFLKIKQESALLVLAFGAVVLFLSAVLRGGLLGLKKFGQLSVLRVVEALIQLSAGWILVYAGYGASGAIGGTVLGLLIVFISINQVVRPQWKTHKEVRHGDSRNTIYFSNVFLFLLFANVFINLDVLAAKHYFFHADAAQYIAASFMGRFLFLMALSIGMVLFPFTYSHDPDHQTTKTDVLFKAMKYFVMIALPCILLAFVFKETIVNVFYGDGYLMTASILPKMLFTNLLVGISFLTGLYALSRNNSLVWLPFLCGTVALFLVLLTPPPSIRFMADAMLIISFFTTIISLAGLGLRLLSK
ncbi:MAG: oligosaccharide flippase family protein [Deltaproteobacteria bacterium]|nr:oligosaccharide flippase family protein [Deltaproteobacteria bacterium]